MSATQHNTVSVIVPVYNSEKYLDRCVKSIVNQTYKNLEIILVDDGSPDGSPQICDEWAKKDDRIVVVHKPNGGISDAQNAGIDRATSDFLMFVDGDDFVADSIVEVCLNLCLEHNADIGQCNFTKVYDEHIVPCEKEDNVRVFTNIEMLYNYFNENRHELRAATVAVWAKIYRKHLFEKVRWPVGVNQEDEATSYKIVYEANKIAVSSKRLYMYFQHEQSFMGSTFSRKFLDLVGIFEEQMYFFEERNLYELRDFAMRWYAYYILDRYSKSQEHISDCEDILKNLRGRYKRIYLKLMLQKNMPLGRKKEFFMNRIYISPIYQAIRGMLRPVKR